MKSKSGFAILAVLLLVIFMGGNVLGADVTYDPATKSIEKTLPSSGQVSETFDIVLTSPNGNYTPPVTVSIEITVTGTPAGVTDSAALALISADNSSLTFTAKAQEKTLGITMYVFSTTTPGTYTYYILSKKPFGPGAPNYPGWGNGLGTNLTLVVNEPTATDTTPPSVTITKPVNDFTFCSAGTSVDIEFNAQDSDSVITAADADVNSNPVSLLINGLGTNSITATGTYIADTIGEYTINAYATSSGGEGHATATFKVNYNLIWLPPLSLGKTSKGGSTIPIKFSARDCDGTFMHDESVKVIVYEVTNTGDEESLSGLFGEGASSVRIDDVPGQYIINFQTASGMHNYRVDVYFNDFSGYMFLQGSKTFSVR